MTATLWLLLKEAFRDYRDDGERLSIDEIKHRNRAPTDVGGVAALPLPVTVHSTFVAQTFNGPGAAAASNPRRNG
jgi:hypothetical protein